MAALTHSINFSRRQISDDLQKLFEQLTDITYVRPLIPPSQKSRNSSQLYAPISHKKSTSENDADFYY
jgi:hypothetical protein